ncbi:hypothetical protein ABKN59_001047 [Abortiporus biennis]
MALYRTIMKSFQGDCIHTLFRGRANDSRLSQALRIIWLSLSHSPSIFFISTQSSSDVSTTYLYLTD